jgi:chromate transporter
MQAPLNPPQSIPLKSALKFWLKLGLISFGGPAGQIAIMHAELVEKRRWISEGRFLHALNYCMLLPGPEAQQLATYIGWLMHRSVGGIAAGVLFVLPSLLILIALSWLYLAFGNQPLVVGIFYGIKPAVCVIVLLAAQRIGLRTLNNTFLIAIALAAFIAIFALHAPFPWIVLSAGLLGFAAGRLAPQWFQPASSHGVKGASDGAAWIDDHSPTPAHARWSWLKFCRVMLIGLALWALPMWLLQQYFGVSHRLTTMAWFFSKAALLTFGGAYAVLPYVVQGAVVQYGWLSPTQMLDGLALGESTPGPLIMVVAFVAYLGGHQGAFFGSEHVFLAGVAAAVIVTWFSFLPSFVFILAGGPLVESTKKNLQLSAPLAAISAAVVGVILNLALYFAYHVFWPKGFEGANLPTIWFGLDPTALVIAVLAGVALLRFKIAVPMVLAGAAVIGACWNMMAAG